ncbi:MAG: universal stress protein [Proteobacteria bacterium]|nr:universal stress protein [Pseudomonadota bacterium]
MCYKDIVVQIADGPDCATRLALALKLATLHGAHLTGLYVEPPLPMSAFPEIPVPVEIIDAQEAAAAQRLAALEQQFAQAARQAGVSAEWRVSHADAVTALNVNARYADLLVTGHSEDSNVSWFDIAATKHIALESGRPVLVVPCHAAVATFGERVLVAWNGSREAVRAVHDALPLLKRAAFVQVVVINPSVGYGDHGAEPGADICRHLARHGIQAEAYVGHADSQAIGAALHQQATAIGADLVVMGAYGHSRFRELVLGGVTRHLLQHLPVPMLMAH